jgi:hypothetical protein
MHFTAGVGGAGFATTMTGLCWWSRVWWSPDWQTPQQAAGAPPTGGCPWHLATVSRHLWHRFVVMQYCSRTGTDMFLNAGQLIISWFPVHTGQTTGFDCFGGILKNKIKRNKMPEIKHD